ncbi:dTMP kinase [Aureimonas sp. AU40]|uniref:dTMP kinase n=1 Tax=Aureimonas sp. AU40 TaxID=1637747 RepID=UPI00078070A5|nr:dTMP kinase [Aureimonas sp. AU40]
MKEATPITDPSASFFLTFEGGEGSGKTTQIARLASFLREQGHEVCTTREPGGTPAADALRQILLSGRARDLGGETEALLFAAGRRDHIEGVILPALLRGEIVLCDRFHDSTRVYQGSVGGVPPETLAVMEAATLEGVVPDLTLILDIPAEQGLQRAATRRGQDAADRFESEPVALHEQRRKAFLRIAASEPSRCVVVDAAREADVIEAEIRRIVMERLVGKQSFPQQLGKPSP